MDGLKSDARVGVAVVCDGRGSASYLPLYTTILSAKIYLLSVAVNQVKNYNKKYIIVIDSRGAKSCLDPL